MTTTQLQKVLAAKPFTPFTLRLADGSRVPVRSPEFAWIHPGGRTVFVATDDDAADIIDLLLVAAIEVGNGRTRRKRR